jgi:hypothetical protein
LEFFFGDLKNSRAVTWSTDGEIVFTVEAAIPGLASRERNTVHALIGHSAIVVIGTAHVVRIMTRVPGVSAWEFRSWSRWSRMRGVDLRRGKARDEEDDDESEMLHVSTGVSHVTVHQITE